MFADLEDILPKVEHGVDAVSLTLDLVVSSSATKSAKRGSRG